MNCPVAMEHRPANQDSTSADGSSEASLSAILIFTDTRESSLLQKAKPSVSGCSVDMRRPATMDTASPTVRISGTMAGRLAVVGLVGTSSSA